LTISITNKIAGCGPIGIQTILAAAHMALQTTKAEANRAVRRVADPHVFGIVAIDAEAHPVSNGSSQLAVPIRSNVFSISCLGAPEYSGWRRWQAKWG
jgi:hypothetical protein